MEGAVAVEGNCAQWPLRSMKEFVAESKTVGENNALPLLGVGLHDGVRVRTADDGRPAPSEDRSGYKLVRSGDLIMNRLGKPHGPVGVSLIAGTTSPAYWVLRVNRNLAEPKFLHYLLRSKH